MGLYEQLKAADILSPIKPLMDRGVIPPMTPDGLIHVRFMLELDEMWIHSKMDVNRRCTAWHKIWFACYKFIPKGCRNCWKVVWYPRTLKEAIRTMQLQEKMGFCSKTGMERRPYTANEGGFSSFWYSDLFGGLEKAREFQKVIYEELKETFGEDIVEPVLKRGCTEMESHYPPSSQWDEIARELRWEEQEALVASVFRLPFPDPRQPTHMKVRNLTKWIEWGYEHSKSTGDFSYEDYLDPETIPTPQLEQYQHSIHSNKDFKPTWEETDGDYSDRPEDAEARIESWLGSGYGSSESIRGDVREESDGGLEIVEGLASA